MSKRLDIVDFLKGFSIFTIVLMHLLQFKTGINILDKALSFGGAGVHVFILCSGFGLYLSHLRKPLTFGSFLKRRFVKVYLPYVFVVILSAILPFYWISQDKLTCLLSHVFMFKMFFEEYECSFGGQMWFVSTIIQFYLCWPLIVKVFEKLYAKSNKYPVAVGCVVSLLWALIVVIVDKSELRVWNSFFLQYLWEFVLGMYWAILYFDDEKSLFIPSVKILIPVAFVCVAITGYAGFSGGYLKMFNDAPSLFAYLSIALVVYKLKLINTFFLFTNKFSYEWYLVHILVFECTAYFLQLVNFDNNLILVLALEFIMSYILGYLYSKALYSIKLK